MSIDAIRENYDYPPFTERDAHADPIEQFGAWFQEARNAGCLLPNAMTLATCSSDGTPSARVVLLKGFDPAGFVFYTNYQSDKADDLKSNPLAALVFYWEKLSRTIRIKGTVAKVSREESEAYFRSRPRGSQLGAWASDQSAVVENRQALHDCFAALEKRYDGQDIPAPPHWGGYRVAPSSIEFWQGQSSRMHDRLRYVRKDAGWTLQRLAP